ncbi:exopolysaccharide transport family protein [Pedobacter sp. AW31-3R]|uniref:exopolysaccharide transport family protein n=1 Tax=Pedobacter sp. AW31-3R TaxID=3445781 RepID=UPI003F9F5A5A
MDFKALLTHFNKYKWFIIIVPIVTLTITYFMVKNLPNQYSSEAQISTGLVDQSKQVATEQNMDYFKLNQQFSNIIEKMKLKKVMSILSYDLMIHDLENPKSPFKKYSPKLDSLTSVQRTEVIQLFKAKLLTKTSLSEADNIKYPLYAYVTSMGYDEETINKKLTIAHSDGSDFINVSYVSENPALSAFLVNTLSTEFIDIYSSDVNYNQNNSIALLDSLLKRKEEVMNTKNAALKNFKEANGVLNLDKQSATIFEQITQNEASKAEALRQIQANQGAISAIEAKLRGSDPYVNSNTASQNRQIVDINNQLKIANDRYIDGGFKASDKKKIDSLTALRSAKTAQNSDDNIVDPTASKQSLIQQRAALGIAMDQAKSSISAIDRELSQLRGKYNAMVPFDAGIQNYERDAELATKDYMDALNRYNLTRTEQNIGLKLNIAQLGLIGPPEPSKRILFMVLAGFASFAICLTAIVSLFYLDNTINTSKQLSNATGSPVIGTLNQIDNERISIKDIWKNQDNPNYMTFKNLLRSLRLEITNHLEADGSKIIGITSLATGEGKSFISSCLAYGFSKTGKKILLIGGEDQTIKNANIKDLAIVENFETFLIKREIHADDNDLITIFKKNADNTSLLENQSSKNLKAGFEVLRNEFDLIIIDVNSLKEINIAKEWLLFTEKNIAVFEVGKTLSETDKEHLQYLKKQPGFIGWVLNKIKIDDKA